MRSTHWHRNGVSGLALCAGYTAAFPCACESRLRKCSPPDRVVGCVTGELSRQRFDTGAVEPVVGWLARLPWPVRACYEAGPTGFGLYRAAVAAWTDCQVIAPSKTPRPSGDRNKSDRRDSDLLLRQLMAGALTPIAVPSPTLEAARDLARAREEDREHRHLPGLGWVGLAHACLRFLFVLRPVRMCATLSTALFTEPLAWSTRPSFFRRLSPASAPVASFAVTSANSAAYSG
jgi:hypothetical protein